MVAQAAGCANDDMRAAFKCPFFIAEIHAADTSGNARTGIGVKPFQFPRHLHGQFARGGDDEGQGCFG